MTQTRIFHSFVDGKKWVDKGHSFLRQNPAATSELIGNVIFASSDTVRDAVIAAHNAFPTWGRGTSPIARGAILRKAAQFAEENLGVIAERMMRETGKTLAEAQGEVKKGISILHFNAGQCFCPNGEHIPTESASIDVSTQWFPVGVSALITPWNFPWAVPLWKIAAAFATGCTVVWKPSMYTPTTSEWICEMFMHAGLPNGVLNMVHGNEHVVRSLISDARVQAVSFTGSNPGGNAVYRMCAKRGLWRVQCEMGGKNGIIVWKDADIEAAARATVSGAFVCAGQRCTATSRAIVHSAVYESYLSAVMDMTRNITMGPGWESGVTMGSLVHRDHMEKVCRAIEEGRKAGTIVLGEGSVLRKGDVTKGYFVAPTVFTDVNPSSSLGQEEIFGPVLAVMPPVTDLETALRILNDTPLGHAGAIFSHDERVIRYFEENADVGLRHFNEATTGAEANTPFGGLKGTAIGEREMGANGIRFFQKQVTNFHNFGDVAVGPSTR